MKRAISTVRDRKAVIDGLNIAVGNPTAAGDDDHHHAMHQFSSPTANAIARSSRDLINLRRQSLNSALVAAILSPKNAEDAQQSISRSERTERRRLFAEFRLTSINYFLRLILREESSLRRIAHREEMHDLVIVCVAAAEGLSRVQLIEREAATRLLVLQRISDSSMPLKIAVAAADAMRERQDTTLRHVASMSISTTTQSPSHRGGRSHPLSPTSHSGSYSHRTSPASSHGGRGKLFSDLCNDVHSSMEVEEQPTCSSAVTGSTSVSTHAIAALMMEDDESYERDGLEVQFQEGWFRILHQRREEDHFVRRVTQGYSTIGAALSLYSIAAAENLNERSMGASEVDVRRYFGGTHNNHSAHITRRRSEAPQPDAMVTTTYVQQLQPAATGIAKSSEAYKTLARSEKSLRIAVQRDELDAFIRIGMGFVECCARQVIADGEHKRRVRIRTEMVSRKARLLLSDSTSLMLQSLKSGVIYNRQQQPGQSFNPSLSGTTAATSAGDTSINTDAGASTIAAKAVLDVMFQVRGNQQQSADEGDNSATASNNILLACLSTVPVAVPEDEDGSVEQQERERHESLSLQAFTLAVDEINEVERTARSQIDLEESLGHRHLVLATTEVTGRAVIIDDEISTFQRVVSQNRQEVTDLHLSRQRELQEAKKDLQEDETTTRAQWAAEEDEQRFSLHKHHVIVVYEPLARQLLNADELSSRRILQGIVSVGREEMNSRTTLKNQWDQTLSAIRDDAYCPCDPSQEEGVAVVTATTTHEMAVPPLEGKLDRDQEAGKNVAKSSTNVHLLFVEDEDNELRGRLIIEEDESWETLQYEQRLERVRVEQNHRQRLILELATLEQEESAQRMSTVVVAEEDARYHFLRELSMVIEHHHNTQRVRQCASDEACARRSECLQEEEARSFVMLCENEHSAYVSITQQDNCYRRNLATSVISDNEALCAVQSKPDQEESTRAAHADIPVVIISSMLPPTIVAEEEAIQNISNPDTSTPLHTETAEVTEVVAATNNSAPPGFKEEDQVEPMHVTQQEGNNDHQEVLQSAQFTSSIVEEQGEVCSAETTARRAVLLFEQYHIIKLLEVLEATHRSTDVEQLENEEFVVLEETSRRSVWNAMEVSSWSTMQRDHQFYLQIGLVTAEEYSRRSFILLAEYEVRDNQFQAPVNPVVASNAQQQPSSSEKAPSDASPSLSAPVPEAVELAQQAAALNESPHLQTLNVVQSTEAAVRPDITAAVDDEDLATPTESPPTEETSQTLAFPNDAPVTVVVDGSRSPDTPLPSKVHSSPALVEEHNEQAALEATPPPTETQHVAVNPRLETHQARDPGPSSVEADRLDQEERPKPTDDETGQPFKSAVTSEVEAPSSTKVSEEVAQQPVQRRSSHLVPKLKTSPNSSYRSDDGVDDDDNGNCIEPAKPLSTSDTAPRPPTQPNTARPAATVTRKHDEETIVGHYKPTPPSTASSRDEVVSPTTPPSTQSTSVRRGESAKPMLKGGSPRTVQALVPTRPPPHNKRNSGAPTRATPCVSASTSGSAKAVPARGGSAQPTQRTTTNTPSTSTTTTLVPKQPLPPTQARPHTAQAAGTSHRSLRSIAEESRLYADEHDDRYYLELEYDAWVSEVATEVTVLSLQHTIVFLPTSLMPPSSRPTSAAWEARHVQRLKQLMYETPVLCL